MWRALEFEHGRTIAQRKKVEKIASKKVAGKSKK
jgi:hypothetical protein